MNDSVCSMCGAELRIAGIWSHWPCECVSNLETGEIPSLITHAAYRDGFKIIKTIDEARKYKKFKFALYKRVEFKTGRQSKKDIYEANKG